MGDIRQGDQTSLFLAITIITVYLRQSRFGFLQYRHGLCFRLAHLNQFAPPPSIFSILIQHEFDIFKGFLPQVTSTRVSFDAYFLTIPHFTQCKSLLKKQHLSKTSASFSKALPHRQALLSSHSKIYRTHKRKSDHNRCSIPDISHDRFEQTAPAQYMSCSDAAKNQIQTFYPNLRIKGAKQGLEHVTALSVNAEGIGVLRTSVVDTEGGTKGTVLST